jgi:hypothetical protein
VKPQDSRRERVTPISPLNHLDAGRSALARGDWQAARVAFERSLADAENPEALEGLGLAAWWLDLAEVVFDVRERAYRIYRERDDSLGAARMAVWIAWDTAAFRGEQAIANGWLQRAHRLLESCPAAPEHAWLALRRGVFALLDDGDPEVAATLASDASNHFAYTRTETTIVLFGQGPVEFTYVNPADDPRPPSSRIGKHPESGPVGRDAGPNFRNEAP